MVLIKTPQHIYISPKDCWNDYFPSCLEWWSSCILVGGFPLPMEWDVIPGFMWIIISPLKNDQIEGNKPHVLHGSFAICRKTFWHHDVILALHAGKVPTAVLHSTTTIAFQSIGWHANFTLGSHTAYPQKNEATNVDSLTFWGDGERESTVDSLEQPLSPVVPAPARCVRMTSGNPIHTRSMVDSNGINAVSNAMSQDLSKVGEAPIRPGIVPTWKILKTRPSDWCLFEGHLFFWRPRAIPHVICDMIWDIKWMYIYNYIYVCIYTCVCVRM